TEAIPSLTKFVLKVRNAGHFIQLNGRCNVDVDFILILTSLGCDEDYPVGTTASIERSCSSTFKEVDALHVVRVDVGKSGTRIIRTGKTYRPGLAGVHWRTINHDQRRVVSSNGVEAADDDLTRSTRLHRCRNVNSRYFSRKGFERVGVDHIGNLFTFNKGSGIT